jgi:alcohol dehydrogenase class IV
MSLIRYLTRIHFADRVLEDALPEEMRRQNLRRPMLILDRCGTADDILDLLEDALPAGAGAPRRETASRSLSRLDLPALRERYAPEGCDCYIALGGPEALDVARLAAGAAGDPALPVIAIPTTTASVGLGPVSLGLTGPGTCQPPVPAVILCDPTLTLWAGRELTAAAGMDALSHCIEAYLSTAFNPPADGIALEGVRRAGQWLRPAVRDGADLDARRELLAAALNGGLAAQKGLGGVDAAARAVETEAGIASRHGICHAALLPHVLAFNAPAVAERFDALRAALGLAAGVDLPGALAGLGADLGLPPRLSDLGLVHRSLRRAAREAAGDPANRTNPRHATEEDYLGILEAAF